MGIMLLFPLLLLAAQSCMAAPQRVAHDDGGDIYAPLTCGPEFPVPFGTVEAKTSHSDFFHHINIAYGINHGDGVVRSGSPFEVRPGGEVILTLGMLNVGRLDKYFGGNFTLAVEVPSSYHDVEIKNDTFKARFPDILIPGNWRTLRCDGGQESARNSALVYAHPFTLKSNHSLAFSAVWKAPEFMDTKGRAFIDLQVSFTMNAGPTGLFLALRHGVMIRYMAIDEPSHP